MTITVSVDDAKSQIGIGEQWAVLETDEETVIQFTGSFGSAAKIASSTPNNKVGRVAIAVNQETVPVLDENGDPVLDENEDPVTEVVDVESVEFLDITDQTSLNFWSYSE